MYVPYLIVAAISLASTILSAKAPSSHTSVTLESLFNEMLDRDARARMPEPSYVCRQASSYDRRSKTPNDAAGWFANNDWSQFIRSEMNGTRREWVMMDADGPGCVVRIWWGGMMPPKNARVRFYLNGATEPAIEAPAYDLLVGRFLTERPLAMENAHGAPGAPGGMNLFLPIPYATHCKITWDDVNVHNPLDPPESRWYNIEYRTYGAGTKVESFTMEKLASARNTMNRVCQFLSCPENNVVGKESKLNESIQPGNEKTLLLPSGSSAIRTVELRVDRLKPEETEKALRALVLQFEFDGEQTVWCPVSDFFGSGLGLNEHQSWYRSVGKDGTMLCRWVMPYRKTARVTLANFGKLAVSAKMSVWTSSWKWDSHSLLFHANWRCQNDIATRPYSDWNYLTATGQGVYMGDTLTVFNPVADWWGEGDEKIYTDGESFPSHFGTGSEDYYGYSWGNTSLFHGPFSNQPRCDGPGNRGYTVVTRTRDLDAIPFKKSLKFDMEVWHWADCRVSYAVATYWYARPGATNNRPPMPEMASADLPSIPPPLTVKNAVECETAKIASHSPDLRISTQNGGLQTGDWSGGGQLFVQAEKPGDYIELVIPATSNSKKRLSLYATKSWDYGKLMVTVNGEKAITEYDSYSGRAMAPGPIELGVFAPVDGRFILRVEVVGSNPLAQGTGCFFGLDCVAVNEE